MHMAIKLGRGVTYHEGVPPIKSHDPLITWSCKITRQTKPIYFHCHNAYGHKTCYDSDLT